tara:strand:+ start:2699 stop:2923 length:225 start_codon:yes stop_codon:yes gene_type:complete
MKTIKNLIAPIKIFICVLLSTFLSILTMVAFLPVGHLFDIGDTGGLTIFVISQLVYFITTAMYLFNKKESRHVK